jgi:glycosyltransferase involved in cell wall biosynthesis
MRKGMISFIVPAHNEELLVGQALSALELAARASREKFEIIVVDDSSTDHTSAIATEHGAKVISIQRRQIAAARNAGARQAQGDILFFVDADTLATPKAVAAGVQAIRHGAVGGGCVFNFDGSLKLCIPLPFPWDALFGSWVAASCFVEAMFFERSAASRSASMRPRNCFSFKL